ncbi:nuclear transport factor 2 family protein [Sphingosinicella terrae]|uniref:nuclear transport factor 2 family protein n=1 Tax=Sphingosinicella terrae TaxID=2172047 RepID=UPI0013B44FD7|nr:nuclear transport factor 2 family protein [Sphingosinicella terrae]
MKIPLPDPIRAYFDANRRLDAEAMLAPFAPEAVVRDERRTHRGRDAIRAWILEASVASQAVAEPQSVRAEGGVERVAARVSGAFPGSPVILDFRFSLASGRIAALEIG